MPPPEEVEPPAPKAPRADPFTAPRREAQPAPPPAPGTVVILKNGARFEGRLVEEKPDSITLETAQGGMTFPRNQVESIRKDGEAPAGKPAEKGGGDDGAKEAFQRFHAAVLEQDLEEMKRWSAKANRAEMEGDPDVKEKLAMVRAFTPVDVEVSPGEVRGDSAELNLVEKGGQGRTGTATLMREDGEWRVGRISWEMGEMKP